MTSDTRKPCLHCLINATINDYGEHRFNETGKGVNIHDEVDDLLACAAELLAMMDHNKNRHASARSHADRFVKWVKMFRDVGRYPGGKWNETNPVEH